MDESKPVQANEDWGQALSDLADGRATPEQAQALSLAWKSGPEIRRDWHALQLIGDSLRSAELAHEAQAPADLLAVLRSRLATEPVPLRRHRWQAWLAPFAVAASFVLVALAVPDLQSMLYRAEGDQLALQSPGYGAPVPATGATLTSAQPSFAQSVAEPALRAVSLVPAGSVDAVAPFELAVPAVPAVSAAARLTTSASAAR